MAWKSKNISDDCMVVSISNRLNRSNTPCSSIAKNTVIELTVDNAKTINGFCAKWGSRLILDDDWALFAHRDVVKPIILYQEFSTFGWQSISSTIAIYHKKSGYLKKSQ